MFYEKIGVVRVSRKNQHTDRQEYNILKKYPDAKIIKIIYSGARVIGQKEFDNTVKKLQKGQTLIFDAVTRMSRNSAKGVALYEELFIRGVEIEFLKDSEINTSVYRQALNREIKIDIDTGQEHTDKFLNTVIKGFNEMMIDLAKDQVKKKFDKAQEELENIQQTTKEGMERAKNRGKRIGTPKGTKLTTKKSIVVKEKILEHSKDFNGTLNDIDCMALTGVARNTFYKYKREIWEEYGEEDI